MNKPIASIITVNYFSADQVLKLSKTLPVNNDIEFIVVDNSVDADQKRALQTINRIDKLVVGDSNLGFGKANNLGASHARADILFILNPDTEIINIDFREVINQFKNSPKLAILAPKIVNIDGSLQRSAHKKYPNWWSHLLDYNPFARVLLGKFGLNNHPTLFSDIEHNNNNIVAKSVLGAAMFVCKDIFNKIGGFDERFFLYREETDLCRRVVNKGYKIVFYPEFAVKHVSGGASKNSDLAEFNKYYIKSSYIFLSKWQGKMYYLFCWVLGIFGSLMSFCIYFVAGKVNKKYRKIAKKCLFGAKQHASSVFGRKWYY